MTRPGMSGTGLRARRSQKTHVLPATMCAGPVGRVAALRKRRGKSELQPGRVLDNVQAG